MIRKLLIGIISIFTVLTTNAKQGASFSYLLIARDPAHLRGYQASIWWQPKSWVFAKFSIYLDGAFSHWYVPDINNYHSTTIYAIAPVLRGYFAKHPSFMPYFELSIGPSYLTRTRLDDRNLGMHFAFQDMIGIGAVLGAKQHFALSFRTIHYSNGSLCRMNAGITVPLMLQASYAF